MGSLYLLANNDSAEIIAVKFKHWSDIGTPVGNT